MTRTWQITKEITGKSKVNSNKFPKSINKKKKTLWPLFVDGVQLPQG